MWFSSIYLKTLREYRTAMLAWGLGLGGFMFIALATFSSIATPAALAALQNLAPAMRWYNEPIAITAPPGYATWRMAPLMLTLGVWALLAGSRTLRGEEDQGQLDVVLAVPRSRLRVIVEKGAALLTALLVMGGLIGLLTFLGGQRAAAGFGLVAALLFGLNAALTAGVFGALALLVAQFTRQRGAAAGLTGLLLALGFILDSTARTADLAWLASLTPIAAYHASKPLISSVGVNGSAFLILAGLIMGLFGVSTALFVRRDIGAPAVTWPHRQGPARPGQMPNPGAWSFSSVFVRALGVVAGAGRWWALGIAGVATWIVFMVKQLEATLIQFLENTPLYEQMQAMLGGQQAGVTTNLLSVYLIFLVLALTIFAITQVNRWASSEEEGQLDLILTTPQPRGRVILASFAAFAIVLLGIALVMLVGMLVATRVAALPLDPSRLVAAILSMAPLGLIVAAVGYLLAGWAQTRVVTGLLSALVLGSFFLAFVGPMLQWPEGMLRLSIFHHYGSPLLNGVDWTSMLVLLLLAGLALAGAAARFQRKDIAR